MIGAIVGEYFGGSLEALGVQIQSSAALFDFERAWAAIVVACVLGIAFYLAVALAERLAVRWHPSARGDAGQDRPNGNERKEGRMKRRQVVLRRGRRRGRRGRGSAATARRGGAPATPRRAPAARRRSRCSSSGSRRRSSPATTRRRRRATTRQAGLDVTIKPGGPDIMPEQVVAGGQARVRHRLAAEPARDPRQGRRPRQHRAGLRALGHDRAHLEGQRDQHDREDEGQEGRRLAAAATSSSSSRR